MGKWLEGPRCVARGCVRSHSPAGAARLGWCLGLGANTCATPPASIADELALLGNPCLCVRVKECLFDR